MRHSLPKYLYDVQSALQEIEDFIAGYSLDDYLKDAKTRRAVERNFITVGEALNKVAHAYPESKTRIADIRKIANFRNILVHEYDEVDDQDVFGIAVKSAPILRKQIDDWMRELGTSAL